MGKRAKLMEYYDATGQTHCAAAKIEVANGGTIIAAEELDDDDRAEFLRILRECDMRDAWEWLRERGANAVWCELDKLEIA
ncbi:MAG: hypothetical protein WC977_10715 [Anaerovoracaceae bacterium]|jgi:hypothetical protein